MKLYRTIKTNARQALQHNWGKAIGILLLTVSVPLLFLLLETLAYLALDLTAFEDIRLTAGTFWDDAVSIDLSALIVTGTTSLLLFLMFVPLCMGVFGWYYRLAGSQPEEVAQVFSFFSGLRAYFRSLWLAMNLLVRSLLWSILFLLPGSALLGWMTYLSGRGIDGEYDSALLATGRTLGGLLVVLGVLCLLLLLKRYFLTVYLVSARPELSIRRIIRLSVRYTRGHRSDLLLFDFTMLGWGLISLLVLPLLYTMPYYCATTAIYARYLTERGERLECAEQRCDIPREEKPLPEEEPTVPPSETDYWRMGRGPNDNGANAE